MTDTQKTLVENIVAYFACEYHDRCESWPYQTWLYKALALLDFRSLHLYGHPVTGLEYSAYAKGPVPNEIYNNRDNLSFSKFHFKETGANRYIVIAEEPDCDMIPGMYIDMMDTLCDEFARPIIVTNDISDASHDEVKAWRPTWERAKKINPVTPPSLPISYDDEMSYIKDPLVLDAYSFYKGCRELASKYEAERLSPAS